jgi:hypothetical protein
MFLRLLQHMETKLDAMSRAMVEMNASTARISQILASQVASQYGEDLEIETQVTEFRRSSFFVQHKVMKRGTLALSRSQTAGSAPA